MEADFKVLFWHVVELSTSGAAGKISLLKINLKYILINFLSLISDIGMS
jgi:hypothetical protein